MEDEKNFQTNINVTLFPHQITSVLSMEKIEREKFIIEGNYHQYKTIMGILGDIPGYGKSLTIVSLMARDKMEWKASPSVDYEYEWLKGPFNIYSCIDIFVKRKVDENLIVASTSIISQWEEYFTHSELKVTTIDTKASIEEFKFGGQDVVIVSPTMFNNFLRKVGGETIIWKRFIYDEPGITHIPNMSYVFAGFYWFVTATYKNLLNGVKGNRTHFLNSLFNRFVTSPYLLKKFLIKNDDEYVKSSFKIPETIFKYHKYFKPAILNVIQNHISEDIYLMLQAGDVSGALHSMGSETNSNIYDIVSKKKMDQLKVAEFKESMYKEDAKNPERYQKWSNVVKRLIAELEEMKQKYENVIKEDCCICYSSITEPVLVPCCQNIFCGECCVNWFKTKINCPLCRSAIDPSKIIHITNDKKEEKKLPKEERKKTKGEVIIDIIKSKIELEETRILIFSEFDETFNVIRKDFIDNKINYIELTGIKTSKDKKLLKFKNGNVKVLFLNSKTNCAGINLQHTTDIIFYHPMSIYTSEQIIGRANRIGRVGNLTVHNFTDT